MAQEKNQGEGNWEAARAYNRDATQHAKSGKSEAAAKDAERAIDGPEGRKLREAEMIGKRHSHGEDPALKK